MSMVKDEDKLELFLTDLTLLCHKYDIGVQSCSDGVYVEDGFAEYVIEEIKICTMDS